jgi:hypothetical protein
MFPFGCGHYVPAYVKSNTGAGVLAGSVGRQRVVWLLSLVS